LGTPFLEPSFDLAGVLEFSPRHGSGKGGKQEPSPRDSVRRSRGQTERTERLKDEGTERLAAAVTSGEGRKGKGKK
jgi:hypothetical protein